MLHGYKRLPLVLNYCGSTHFNTFVASLMSHFLEHALTCGRLIFRFRLSRVTRPPLTSPRRVCPRLCASSCWPTSGKRGETGKRTRRKMRRGSRAACPIRPSWSSRSWMWTEKCWTSSLPLTTKQVCVSIVPHNGVYMQTRKAPDAKRIKC